MLSVIVPTKNRAESLERLLNSLLKQTIEKTLFEIIIVDNGSVDNTEKIVAKWKKILKNIRYFYEQNPGLHVGRNKGCKEARGNLLIYCDDDIEPYDTWLQTIKTAFDNPDVVLVGGKCLPKFENRPPEWLIRMWEPNIDGDRILGYLSLIDLGEERFIDPMLVFGCNFSIRRSVLLDAGGFHPDAMPQDLIRFRGDGESYISHMIKAKGLKAIFCPKAAVYHWVSKSRMTIEYFCLRAYNQGVSDSYTIIRRENGLDNWPCSETKANNIHRIYSNFIWQILHLTLNELINFPWQWINRKILQYKIYSAYKKGYDYHQSEVKVSQELLDWVLLSNYWNVDLPVYVSNVKD